MPRHQELAVEDMRHELDDEGRREFFEEQGEDGDGGGGGGRYGLLVECCAVRCLSVFVTWSSKPPKDVRHHTFSRLPRDLHIYLSVADA